MKHTDSASRAEAVAHSSVWSQMRPADRELAQLRATLAVYGVMTEVLEALERGTVFNVTLPEGLTTADIREGLRQGGLVKTESEPPPVTVNADEVTDLVKQVEKRPSRGSR